MDKCRGGGGVDKNILKTAKGTPRPALLNETGLIPIYLHKVITVKDNRIQKTILYYQILQPELNQRLVSIGQQCINSTKEYTLH